MAKKKKKKQRGQKKSSDLPYLLSQGKMTRNIMGAEFDPSYDNVAKLDEMIKNGVNKDLDEIRVMFISEASFLHTGFSTYAKAILERLHKNPKFVVGELGSYGSASDPRAASVPWQYYSNMPSNPQEEQSYKADYQKNQFGLFKYAQVMEDFKPDVILLHRDHWMDEGIVNHPATKKTHVIWMACVDSYPQKWEWMKSFQEVDTLLSYSHFGRKVLEDQSREPLAKIHDIKPLECDVVAQAGVNPEEFHPLDKDSLRLKYGLDPKMKIVGTVMRNQPRKLFPRIMDSFADFLKKYPEAGQNAYLLLHTGIPDVGFDIPESMFRAGIEHRTLFSIKCNSCQNNFVEQWGFLQRPCKSCGAQTLVTPNTANGLNNEKFNEIFNLMNLYVQGSIAGADEMPATEAKACGVPVTCTDYAAMYEKNRNGGGLPINVETMYTEAETMQNRAMFCRKSLTENINTVLSSDFTEKRMSAEARQTVLDYYNWDIAAKKWEALIMNAELKDRSCWEPKTIGCIINADGYSDEEVNTTLCSVSTVCEQVLVKTSEEDRLFSGIELIADSFDEAAKSLDTDFVLRLNAGEELGGSLGATALAAEAKNHWDFKGNFSVIVIEENEYGIEMNNDFIQPRFGAVTAKEADNGNELIIAANQQSAQLFTAYRNFLKQLDETKEGPERDTLMENFKVFYERLGATIDHDLKTVFHIVRKRSQ